MAHLLIADDISISRETLARVLRDAGHRVTSVASGQEAIDRVRTERPDMVILDLNMPRMTGLQAASTIKSESAGPFIPILILSGRTLSSPEMTEVMAIADDFLRKPYAPSEICARIEVWLRTRRLVDDSAKATAHGEAEMEGAAPPDMPARLRTRSTMLERIDEEWRRALRWNEPFALLLCDMVDAQQARGAQAESALLNLSRTALRVMRNVDILGQMGPTRLGALLPNTHLAGALCAAERLRGELLIASEAGPLSAALAMGLALVPGRDITGPNDLCEAAEAALLRACAEGPWSLCLQQHQGYLVRAP